jgi:two-component system response regulator RegA
MKHFLIIDDDETFASVLARSIARRGYQTHTANDAETALALLHAQTTDGAITHVVLDLKLSKTTGLQLLPQF